MKRIPRWPIITGSILGAVCTVVGVQALFHRAHDTRPALLARWLVGLALAHDLVVVPVVLAIGALVRRRVPLVARAEIAGALIVSGAIALEAWPALQGYGRLRSNGSVLPRDYSRGLVITLIGVWLVAALVVAVRHYRTRQR